MIWFGSFQNDVAELETEKISSRDRVNQRSIYPRIAMIPKLLGILEAILCDKTPNSPKIFKCYGMASH